MGGFSVFKRSFNYPITVFVPTIKKNYLLNKLPANIIICPDPSRHFVPDNKNGLRVPLVLSVYKRLFCWFANSLYGYFLISSLSPVIALSSILTDEPYIIIPFYINKNVTIDLELIS